MLCGDLSGKEIQGRGDICICVADSLCYKAETNTPLWSNYTPIKMLKKNKNKLLSWNNSSSIFQNTGNSCMVGFSSLLLCRNMISSVLLWWINIVTIPFCKKRTNIYIYILSVLHLCQSIHWLIDSNGEMGMMRLKQNRGRVAALDCQSQGIAAKGAWLGGHCGDD